jgi:hypothetical protein
VRTWLARLGRRLPELLAVTPLGVAAVRAIQSDWYPIGDNAFFALRARDVLTEHHPLLGTWTSASLTVGTTIHNPGPLLFDGLAGPAKVDPAAGTILAVVALHAAAVVLGVVWARRVAGPPGAWAISAAFLALEWAMGSEILVEPWQPHSLLLPFLAFLVLAWALAAGHAGALPWAAGLASLILQTHLSYAVIVPALAVVGVGTLVALEVRANGGEAAWAHLRRPLLVAVVVFAVAWAQPVVDQVAGEGNLGKVVTTGAGDGEVAGPRFAGSVLASVGAVPGGWGPGGFEGLVVDLDAPRAEGTPPPLGGLTDLGSAAPWVVLAGALAGVAAWAAWRERSRPWVSALAVAAVGLLATFVTVALLPLNEAFGIGAHQIRPVWPVVLFTTAVVVTILLRLLPRSEATVPLLAVVLALLALPAHNPRTGPSADGYAMPIVRDLVAQMDEIDGSGLVYVDLTRLRFAEPYSTPVLLELQRRGVEFVADEEPAAQLGPSRVLDADDPVEVEMRIVEGGAAMAPEPGWDRIAYVAGLDDAETAELAELEAVRTGEPLAPADEARRAELDRRQRVESVAVLVRDA